MKGEMVMKRRSMYLVIVCLVALGTAEAQNPPAAADPLSSSLKRIYDSMKRNIIESAEKMPDANFDFKPTPEVKSYAEMLGHVADSQYGYCARLKGEASPMKESVERTKKAKTEMVEAVKAAFAYCDGIFGSMTDDLLKQTVKVGTQDVPKAFYAAQVVSHISEHYGNLVTYLRLKGLVPPSTERSQQPRRGN
jgi:uncharacterized damage-inducible protein DinB